MSSKRSDVVKTTVSVANGRVEVTLGDIRADIPVDRIEAFVQLLQAAKVIAEQVGGGAVAPAPAAAAPAPAEAPTSARPAKPERKRRSRKRVGDALVSWMQDHPGWHTEEQLLAAVKSNRMTDANPKRALKIALGKQRGSTFESDGGGHWKLADDTSAGPPPKAADRKRRAAKEPRKARASAAAPARKRVDSGARATVAEAAMGVPARSKRRVRLKTKPRGKDENGLPLEEGGDEPAPEAAEPRGGSIIRIPRARRAKGERRQVTRPQAREDAEAAGEPGGPHAFPKIAASEKARFIQNLVSIGKEPGPGADDA